MEDDLCSEVHIVSLQMHSCCPQPVQVLHARYLHLLSEL